LIDFPFGIGIGMAFGVLVGYAGCSAVTVSLFPSQDLIFTPPWDTLPVHEITYSDPSASTLLIHRYHQTWTEDMICLSSRY
jgi:hypothetical protein